jgi:hypothetical protein
MEQKKRVLVSGTKPAIYGTAMPTKRLQRSAAKQPPLNCIQVARRFEAELKLPSSRSYTDVGERFGVSRVTVCYNVALLKRLPRDFIAWLESCTEEAPLRFFSLKRLRPVTLLSGDRQQQALRDLAERLSQKMNGAPSKALRALERLLYDAPQSVSTQHKPGPA